MQCINLQLSCWPYVRAVCIVCKTHKRFLRYLSQYFMRSSVPRRLFWISSPDCKYWAVAIDTPGDSKRLCFLQYASRFGYIERLWLYELLYLHGNVSILTCIEQRYNGPFLWADWVFSFNRRRLCAYMWCVCLCSKSNKHTLNGNVQQQFWFYSQSTKSN